MDLKLPYYFHKNLNNNNSIVLISERTYSAGFKLALPKNPSIVIIIFKYVLLLSVLARIKL